MDEIDAAAERSFAKGMARMNATPPDLAGAVGSFTRALFLAPNVAAVHAQKGEALLRLCDFAAALLAFRRAHALDPGDASIRARLSQVHYLHGRLHLEAGELDAAVQSLSAALQLNPAYSDCWMLRIKCWIRGKRYGRALNELNTLITQAGQEGGGGGEPQRSNSDPSQQLPHSPSHATRRSAFESQRSPNKRSQLEESKEEGGLDDASSFPSYSRHPSMPDLALPANLDAAAAAPALLSTPRTAASNASVWRTIQALILRAKLHILLDRSDLALRDARWARSLAPCAEVTELLQSLSQKAQGLMGSATAHLLANQQQDALNELSRALELDDEFVEALAMRASLYRNAQRWEESLRDLQRALEIVAARKEEKRRRQEAEQAAQSAEAGAEGDAGADPEAQLAGGQTFLSEVTAGDTATEDPLPSAASTRDNGDGAETDPQQQSLERSLALTLNGLGVHYYASSQLEQARSCLTRAIDLDASRAQFYSNRGDVLLRLGETAAALDDFHRSLRLDSTSRNYATRTRVGSIHATRGRGLFNAQQYAGAIDAFSHAIAVDPCTSSHFLARGRACFAAGRFEAAYRDAEEAVRLRPGDEVARAFLLQLRQSLLRPADLARAAPLPPVPARDTPWDPAVAAQQQKQKRARHSKSSRFTLSGTGGIQTQQQLAHAARQSQRNGLEVMRMVFDAEQAQQQHTASSSFRQLQAGTRRA